MFEVKFSVKGARRINTKAFNSRTAAERFAAQWRRSNSNGDYIARVVQQ